MRPLLFSFAALLLIANAAFAQNDDQPTATHEAPIAFGTTYQLSSKVTGKTHEINIWAPPLTAENQNPPVLYVIDGGLEQDFLHIAGLAQLGALSWTFKAPIVVGIKTDNRRYQLTPEAKDPRYSEFSDSSGGADDFHAFLETDVIPFVESRFPAGKQRALIGESLAGLFVAREFLRYPETFTDYISISPSLWWDDRALAREADNLLAKHGESTRRLYLTMGDEGGTMQDGLDRLITALETAAPSGLEWTYVDRRESETHATIYHGAALDALRRFYAYPPYDYGETPWYLIEGASPPVPE